MGTFNRLMDATFSAPRTWELNSALSFDCDKVTEQDIASLKQVGVKVSTKGRVTASKGFKSDLASVPRACWMFIAPFDIARAGVIHDYIYFCIRKYRETVALNGDTPDMVIVGNAKKVADDIFKAAMESSEPKVAKWKIFSAYWAVKLFGRWSIIPREEL